MAKTFKTTQALTFSLGRSSEMEVECEVHFEFTLGTAEVGAGYLADPDKYDPGSPDEVFVTRAFLTEKGHTQDALPGWMFHLLTTDEEFLASLASIAIDQQEYA